MLLRLLLCLLLMTPQAIRYDSEASNSSTLILTIATTDTANYDYPSIRHVVGILQGHLRQSFAHLVDICGCDEATCCRSVRNGLRLVEC